MVPPSGGSEAAATALPAVESGGPPGIVGGGPPRRKAPGGPAPGARALFAVLVGCLAVLAGCAPRRAPPAPLRPGWSETGIGSWYGLPFHGRPTASGEIYDMEAMTAAHPWLPFGTVVRVVNRANGRSATVRINDRGPFRADRIIDLSRAAARRLGLLGPGTAPVRVVVVELSRVPSCLLLQLGAYRERGNVERAKRRARKAGAAVREEPVEGGLVRVLAGPFGDPRDALEARRRLGGFLRGCEGSAGPEPTGGGRALRGR